MNSTPLVFQGCMAVVSLSSILEYAFHKWGGCPKWRGGCGRVRCHKLGSGSVPSVVASGVVGVGSGVCGNAGSEHLLMMPTELLLSGLER